MTLGGTFTFRGPRERVWELLQDPAVLAKTLPGTKTLVQTSPERYEGVMKVSIGPVTAAEFSVAVTMKDRTAPAHFAMDIDGKGGLGFVRGTATIDLAEQDGATLMSYSSDVAIGGRIAMVGQRLIESVGKTMARQALDALDAELTMRLGSGA